MVPSPHISLANVALAALAVSAAALPTIKLADVQSMEAHSPPNHPVVQTQEQVSIFAQPTDPELRMPHIEHDHDPPPAGLDGVDQRDMIIRMIR